MKLWEKVNNVTGNASKARFLVENINIASKWLVNSLPERFLWSVATDTSADSNQEGLAGWDSDGAGKFGTGSSIAFDRILGVNAVGSLVIVGMVSGIEWLLRLRNDNKQSQPKRFQKQVH